TAADLGSPLAVALGMRRYVGTGRGRGPRLLVAGTPLVTAEGYLTDILEGELVRLGAVRPVGDPQEATQAVRELVDAGVDHIKIALQHRGFDRAELPVLDEPTLCAAIAEAHRQETRVLVHATE